MTEKAINVCYCITDKTGNYARLLGTSMYSLLSNTQEQVFFHILHDDTMTGKNKSRIEDMVTSFSGKVFFYNIDVIMPEEIKKIDANMPELKCLNVSIASIYRLMLGKLFYHKIKKVIYLDCDTIINMNIKELWEEDLPESGLAAVTDAIIRLNEQLSIFKKNKVTPDEYFNSGVLMIDIDKFAESFSLEEAIKEFGKDKLDFPDQDVLNMMFRKSNTLPERYNVFADIAFVLEKDVGACIYHYVGDSFSFDMHNPFSKLFFSYFIKTPWCDVEFIGSMATKSVEAFRHTILTIANGFAGRKRVVIADKDIEDYLSELLCLKKNEKFIPADTLEKINLNINYYNEFLIFFLPKKSYDSIKEQLTGMGLKENVNFAWGNCLLERVANSEKPVKDGQLFLM